MSKSLEETQNYYDAIAKGYPELYHQEQIEKISLIKHLLPSSGKLLDLGAGAGVLNQFISKEVNLISFDLSQELLNLNSNKNQNKIQGDICNLPFKDNEFNSVSSFTVIQDVYNIEKALNEVLRVIKPQGKLIISFLKRSKNKESIETFLLKYFKVEEKIEEFKDLIYILKKN